MRPRRRSGHPVPIILSLLLPVVLSSLLVAPQVRGAVPHVFESVDTTYDEGDIADKTTTLAQSFVATANYKLLWLEVFARDYGRSDIALVQVFPDSGGFPAGGLMAQGNIDGSSDYDWLRVSINPQPVLVAGSRYWITLTSFENSPDAYRWAKTLSSGYSAGWAAFYQGATWNQMPLLDFLFRTWGIQGPAISVGITADASSAGAGDPLQYTVTFDNIGTGPASRVWINWTPSSDVTYVSDDASASGGMATASGWVFTGVDVGPHDFRVHVRTNEDVFEGLPLTTSVRLTYADGPILQEPSVASATTIARVPSLIVGSSASPLYVAPGDNLSYSVTISNVGSRSASRVWLNDTLPENVTYISDTAPTLANYSGSWRSGNVLYYNFTEVPGGVFTFIINVTVNLGIRNGTWLVNWAFANYTDGGGRTREPVKACAIARVHGASIRVAQSTVSTGVQPRETVRFTIWFENAGDVAATHVWINDTLPAGLSYVSDTAVADPSFVNSTCAGPSCAWEFANVPPGPQSFILTTVVAPNLPDGTVLTNRARLSYTDSNGVLLEPSSSAVSVRVSRPWFSLRVSANQFANPGDTLGYFLRIDNQGSGIADAAWLNVTLPSGATYVADNATESGGIRTGPSKWLFRNVTAGPNWVFLAVRLAPGLMDRSVLTSLFSLEHVDDEGNAGVPESATATTTITAPSIGIQAYANRASAERGDFVTYTVLIGNTGSGSASDVWINDTIPDGTTFFRSSLQYVSTSGSEFTWHLYGVSPGTVELNVTIRLEGAIQAGSTLQDRFSVAYTDANGNFIAEREASVDVLVVAPVLNPGLTLPITVLILGILVAVLVGFIGWKVYGVGSKDKPRIDELFLLHRSGELVRHLTRSLRPNVDSDALSGMLVAVQDFIKESFRFVQGSLDELKFGSHKLMLAHGNYLIIAAVVGGGHTERLAPVLLSGLDALERELAPALKDWNGMPSALEGVDHHLAEILKGKLANGRAPHVPKPST